MPKDYTKIKEELYNELKKEAKVANQRLVRLERAGFEETFAQKKLRERLELEKVQAFTESGRVRYNKEMTIAQLRATISAVEKFNVSLSTSKRGMKTIKKNVIEGIQKLTAVDAVEISDKDAADLYEMFKDKDIGKFADKSGNHGGSDLIVVTQDAIEYVRQNNQNADEVFYQLQEMYPDETKAQIKKRAKDYLENMNKQKWNEMFDSNIAVPVDSSVNRIKNRIYNKYIKENIKFNV